MTEHEARKNSHPASPRHGVKTGQFRGGPGVEVGARVLWTLRVIALSGLAGSVYLTWVGSFDGLAGCLESTLFDCDHVIHSRWSTWLGLPVSWLAGAGYLGMLTAMAYLGRSSFAAQQRSGWLMLLVLSTAAAGSALWFIGLQIWVTASICPFCMGVHVCSLAIAALAWWRAPIGFTTEGRRSRHPVVFVGRRTAAITAGIGLLAVAGLVGGQCAQPFILKPKPMEIVTLPGGANTDTGKGEDRVISLMGGRTTLKPAEHPIAGSIDAPILMISLFDYNCVRCRRVEPKLAELRKHFGQRLAIVRLPKPQDVICFTAIKPDWTDKRLRSCHYAWLILAVWRADREAFETFDRWLFSSTKRIPPDEVYAHAAKLVGKEKLAKAIADPWIKKQLERNIALYDLAGRGGTPKFIVGSRVTVGTPRALDELIKFVDPPPDSPAEAAP